MGMVNTNKLINVTQRTSRLPWWVWFLVPNIFFIVMTTLIPYLPEQNGIPLVHHFNLAIEMNMGAWWSTVNLLVIAFLAYELFSTSRDITRTAWLILSVVLLLLSLDEIGSLHERVGSTRDLLPYVFVFVLLLAYVLIKLFFHPGKRRSAVWLAVAFGLLGSVVLQEYLEHTVDWPAWSLGFRVGLEESTELFSFLLILAVLVTERQKKIPIHSLLIAIPNPFRMRALPLVLSLGLLFHIVLSFYPPVLMDNQLGNPAIWYPVSLFFILFSIAIWQFGLDARDTKNNIWLIFAAYCGLNSLAGVYLISPRQDISGLYSLGLLTNFYFFYAGQLGLIILFYIKLFKTGKSLFIFIFLVLILGLGFLFGGLATQFIIAGIFTFLIAHLFLNAVPVEQRIPEDVRSVTS